MDLEKRSPFDLIPDFIGVEEFKKEVQKVRSHKFISILLTTLVIFGVFALFAFVRWFFTWAIPAAAFVFTIVFAVLLSLFCVFMFKPVKGWISAYADKLNRKRIEYNPEQVVEGQMGELNKMYTRVDGTITEVRAAKAIYDDDAKHNKAEIEKCNQLLSQHQNQLRLFSTEYMELLSELEKARRNGTDEESIREMEERAHQLDMKIRDIGADIDDDRHMLDDYKQYYNDSNDKAVLLQELITKLDTAQRDLQRKIKSTKRWWSAFQKHLKTVESTEEATKYLVQCFTDEFGNPVEGQLAVHVLFNRLAKASAATQQNMSRLDKILNFKSDDHRLLSNGAKVRELNDLMKNWLPTEESSHERVPQLQEIASDDSHGGGPRQFKFGE